jgi:hypothetical protein
MTPATSNIAAALPPAKHTMLHGDGNQPLPWSTARASGLKPSVASRQRSSTFPYIVPA